MCVSGGLFGKTRPGGFAQYVCVPESHLIPLPYSIKDKDAAAIVLAGTTAVNLVNSAEISDGKSVLVTGATGGVGTLLLQMLKNKLCTVIASTSNPSKCAILKKLGASHIISTDNLLKEVLERFPNGVDRVIDIMGGTVWSQGVKVLAKNGVLVFCSTTLPESGTVELAPAFFRQISIKGVNGGSLNELKSALKLLQNNTIRPVIDSVYPLTDAAQAIQKISRQKGEGKILIRC